MPGIDEGFGLKSREIIASRTSSAGAEKTKVELCALACALVDYCYPFVVVESTLVSVSGVVTCSTSVGAVVVKLNEQKIELCAGNCEAHVAIREWTLGSTRNQVSLRT